MLNAFQHGQLLVMWYVELPAVATKKIERAEAKRRTVIKTLKYKRQLRCYLTNQLITK